MLVEMREQADAAADGGAVGIVEIGEQVADDFGGESGGLGCLGRAAGAGVGEFAGRELLHFGFSLVGEDESLA
jgi:hypothetical protein